MYYNYAITMIPLVSGDHTLEAHDCIIRGRGDPDSIGIYMERGMGTITAEITGTTVSGWGTGVEYWLYDSASEVTLDVECDDFSNNDYNVIEYDWTGEDLLWREICPNP